MNRRTILKALGVPVAALTGSGGWLAWAAERNPYYDGPVSDHFDGVRFFNPGVPPYTKGALDAWRALVLADKVPWPEAFPSPFRDRPPKRVDGARLRAALVGHASFLIQTGGLNILTDPVWSDRASPYGFAGPKRANPPGIAFEDLPEIDAVLVTHNHYDHLDLATLSRLAARGRPRVITPLGNDTIIASHDPAILVEARDWGDRVVVGNDVAVSLEPSLHWSARGLSDRRKALWCSFVIETPGGAIFHVGDASFGDGTLYAETRRKFGPIRLALLPIGAYEPRWFMRDHHMNPDEAVRALIACGAASALGHHWGTFRLTSEGVEEPVEALRSALAVHNVAPERFRAMRPGEVWEAGGQTSEIRGQ